MPQAETPKYLGKTCATHPELRGLRRVKDKLCPKCFNEKRRERRHQQMAEALRIREEHKAMLAKLNGLQQDEARKVWADFVSRGTQAKDSRPEADDTPDTEPADLGCTDQSSE